MSVCACLLFKVHAGLSAPICLCVCLVCVCCVCELMCGVGWSVVFVFLLVCAFVCMR